MHKIKLLFGTVSLLLLILLLTVYNSLLDFNDGKYHSSSDFSLTKKKNGKSQEEYKESYKRHARAQRYQSSAGQAQNTSAHRSSMDNSALQAVQNSIHLLQCNHRYKEEYEAYTDTLDITKLAAAEHLDSPTYHNRTGYVLSLTFREQQTKAAENLYSLQCWAKTLRAYVVEPFIQNSHLIAPVGEGSLGGLRFRDLFNIEHWQKYTTIRGFTPLAGWGKFLKEAPRRLIVVYFKYPKYSYLREQKENKDKITHLAVNDKYTKGCSMSTDLAKKIHYMITTHHFEVVRKVCMNFEHGDELTLFQFNSHVFGNLRPMEHTILMEQWRGVTDIDGGNRVSVYDACWTQYHVDPSLFSWPSHRLICDADKYTSQYLKSNQYIALIVRTEKFKIHGVDRSESRISACLNKTLDTWKKLRSKTKLKLTYLSMDVGKYGSYTLTDKNREEYYPYVHLYESFIREVRGSDFSIEKWEHEFESVASSLDSGYIGSLQKILVARSRCVVFSGGGSFQKHAKFLYEKVHKNKCVKIVQSCSRL